MKPGGTRRGAGAEAERGGAGRGSRGRVSGESQTLGDVLTRASVATCQSWTGLLPVPGLSVHGRASVLLEPRVLGVLLALYCIHVSLLLDTLKRTT